MRGNGGWRFAGAMQHVISEKLYRKELFAD
jgi:hypothetical protein